MRYQTATIMSDIDLAAALRQHLAAYRAATPGQAAQIDTLIALLELLHHYRDDALASLSELGGPTLAELRGDFETLAQATPDPMATRRCAGHGELNVTD